MPDFCIKVLPFNLDTPLNNTKFFAKSLPLLIPLISRFFSLNLDKSEASPSVLIETDDATFTQAVLEFK